MSIRICMICHFSTNDDDQWVTSGNQSAICIRCWERETGVLQPVPKAVEREVAAVLDSISSWPAELR